MAAAGGDLGLGSGSLLSPSESAPEAAAGADLGRGDLGGVTLGIGPKGGGLLELVGWLDLRLITNERDKGSGISVNNHHNLFRGRVDERYPIVWRALVLEGTRRGTPEGLEPVVCRCAGLGKELLRPPTTQTRKQRMRESLHERTRANGVRDS